MPKNQYFTVKIDHKSAQMSQGEENDEQFFDNSIFFLKKLR